jgi:hypothetical protein
MTLIMIIVHNFMSNKKYDLVIYKSFLVKEKVGKLGNFIIVKI